MLNFDDDSYLSLNIGGHVFKVQATSRLAERVRLLAGEASEKADEARENCEGDFRGVEDFLRCIVDTLIGEGTVDTVFGSDEPDVFDLCEIISYVCDEFSSYRRRRLLRLDGNGEEVSL